MITDNDYCRRREHVKTRTRTSHMMHTLLWCTTRQRGRVHYKRVMLLMNDNNVLLCSSTIGPIRMIRLMNVNGKSWAARAWTMEYCGPSGCLATCMSTKGIAVCARLLYVVHRFLSVCTPACNVRNTRVLLILRCDRDTSTGDDDDEGILDGRRSIIYYSGRAVRRAFVRRNVYGYLNRKLGKKIPHRPAQPRFIWVLCYARFPVVRTLRPRREN